MDVIKEIRLHGFFCNSLYILYTIAAKPQYTGQSDKFNHFLTVVNESRQAFYKSLPCLDLRQNALTSSASMPCQHGRPKSMLCSMFGNRTGGRMVMPSQ